MFKLKVIQHSKITKFDLDEIIRIKSVAWIYPYEKQLEWINNNLNDADLHLLLYEDEKAVAYLNLILIDLMFDTIPYCAFGVGNVCAIKKGKGYGTELMKKTNQYIANENSIGFLFCKMNLIVFYKMFDWDVVDENKLNLSFQNENIITMLFNFNLPFNKLNYNKRVF